MTTHDGPGFSTSPSRRTKPRLAAVLISASVCIAFDLVASYAVTSSFLMSPRGPWDDDVLAAIQVSSFAGGSLAALGGLVRILPVSRGWLRWWWLLLPAILLVSAITRFIWVDLGYPA